MALNPSMFALIAEALLIILIGWVTEQKRSFKGVVVNGILVVIAGGNLLYFQKPLGFLLLVYGIFIMLVGLKEEELEALKGRTDWMGKVIVWIGHYATTAVIVIIITLISFNVWPFDFETTANAARRR